LDNESKSLLPHSHREIISAEEIQKRIKELGKQISLDYQGKCPIIIGVLNGAFIFMSDLIREITIDCEVDFIKISSYGNKKQSSGNIKLTKDIDCDVRGRHVIVVEDIVDSGRSIQYLENMFEGHEPQSITFVSLLVKKGGAIVSFHIDYVGFEISNEFVVGYGLDFAQKMRNLPSIYVIE